MQQKLAIIVMLGVVFLAAGALLMTRPSAAATPDGGAGKTVFDAKCAICHKLEQGDQPTGPDLTGVTGAHDRDWLLRMITAPDQVIAGGDPEITALVTKYGFDMPNLGITAGEADSILTYLGGLSGPPPATMSAATTTLPPATAVPTTATAAVTATTTPAATTSTPTATPTPTVTPAKPAGNAAAGHDLFAGAVRLQNGGGACISCHNVAGIGALGGGTLAADMTDVYSRLGAAGLAAILKTTPFPVMKDVFGNRPLTDREIADIIAYLQETGQPPAAAGQPGWFIIIGIIGVAVIAVVFQIIWRKRFPGVRRALVAGGQK